jgi:hypothetical protein
MPLRISKTKEEQWALLGDHEKAGIHPPINYLGFAGFGAHNQFFENGLSGVLVFFQSGMLSFSNNYMEA